mgnify:CR=1 FL=1
MYKLKNTTPTNLSSKGFRQQYDNSWVLRFPVYWYKRIPTDKRDVVIKPEESKRLEITVKRVNGSVHNFWNTNHAHQAPELVAEIDKMISKKMSKIGAKYYDD